MSDDLRSLDVRIAREVMGFDVDSDGFVVKRFRANKRTGQVRSTSREIPPPYTLSDAAAFEALDRLMPKSVMIDFDTEEGWMVSIEPFSLKAQAIDKLRPLAICRAIVAFLDRKESANG